MTRTTQTLRAVRRGLAAAALLAVSALAPAAAGAQTTYTFESGTTGTGFGFTADGYQFENFGVATTASLGAGTNASSGTRFALGRTESSFLFRTDVNFHLLGASFSFRAFDGNLAPLTLVLRGYRTDDPGEAPAFVRALTVTNATQRVEFGGDLGPLNEVEFDTEAFTAGGRQAALALDDVTLATVPEPSTWALLATGLGALVLARAHRRGRG
jgi:hypothetical protein